MYVNDAADVMSNSSAGLKYITVKSFEKVKLKLTFHI